MDPSSLFCKLPWEIASWGCADGRGWVRSEEEAEARSWT
jgi:hypothetical protein